ncbi:MAG: hypothetical protein ACXADH_00475 [Candidatus Kariarchaeaceae archaeon]|jgi:hypothetical protein
MGQDFFDVDSIKEDIEAEANEDKMPTYGSEKWHDYVMSKFHKSELFDGNPVCAGLRRVAEELLGTIVVSRPTQVFPATDGDGPGRATVVFEVVIDWMDSGQLRTYSDVADVWHGNTDDLFCAHPVATASTRAEGRALRKALKVKCLAAEELAKKDVASIVRQTVQANQSTDGEWKEDDSISTPQINFIDAKCKQLDVNVMKFINMGESTYETIEKVSKKTASKMLGVLNEYQTDVKSIPDEVSGYESWR